MLSSFPLLISPYASTGCAPLAAKKTSRHNSIFVVSSPSLPVDRCALARRADVQRWPCSFPFVSECLKNCTEMRRTRKRSLQSWQAPNRKLKCKNIGFILGRPGDARLLSARYVLIYVPRLLLAAGKLLGARLGQSTLSRYTAA